MLHKYITDDGFESPFRARSPQGVEVHHNLWLMVAGIVLIGLVLGFASACSDGSGRDESGEFPAYAYNSAETLSAYKIAQRMPDVLATIPCYCGCGLTHEHKNLRDCFFNQDGSFNDHGSNCHVCAAEALDVSAWHEEGLSPEQIRTQIDAKYSEYGNPTETPL